MRSNGKTLSVTSQSPRFKVKFFKPPPVTLTAQRWPAYAVSTGLFCACNPRTRSGVLVDSKTSVSSTDTTPDITVPVTTVPAPETEKLRSTAKRNWPVSNSLRNTVAICTSVALRSSTASRLPAGTDTMGADTNSDSRIRSPSS